MGFGCNSKSVKTVGGWNVGMYLAASLMIDVIKHEVFSEEYLERLWGLPRFLFTGSDILPPCQIAGT